MRILSNHPKNPLRQSRHIDKAFAWFLGALVVVSLIKLAAGPLFGIF